MSPPKIHPRCAGPVLAEVAVTGGDSKDRTGTVKSVLSCVNVRRFMVASPRGSGMSGLDNGPMCERSQECTQKSSSWEGQCHQKTRPEGKKDRKSTRLNSSHVSTSYAVFCLKKKNIANP